MIYNSEEYDEDGHEIDEPGTKTKKGTRNLSKSEQKDLRKGRHSKSKKKKVDNSVIPPPSFSNLMNEFQRVSIAEEGNSMDESPRATDKLNPASMPFDNKFISGNNSSSPYEEYADSGSEGLAIKAANQLRMPPSVKH